MASKAREDLAMTTIRRAEDRGHAVHSWLDTYHTFSFADYHDAAHMGFHGLRVINEDRVSPGEGFGTHPHRDMEIISYVLSGALEHKDSMGNGSVIRPGDIQRMSAGTGITHSEFNASKVDLVHFLQIWLPPAKRGLTPSYEQKAIAKEDLDGGLRLIASPDGAEGGVTIHTDARLYAGRFKPGQNTSLTLARGRHAWVHVALGKARVNGLDLKAGDGAALSDEPAVKIEGIEDAELLVFDLP
jgi:redox-sensitive bicupin YhaK (pirin superfamily)